MAIAALEYIDVDEHGVARIAGSRITVGFIAVERVHLGWSPEEIQAQHPHLTMAQIHAALAYYYAHKAEVDSRIDATDLVARQMQANASPSPVIVRLQAAKRDS